jgi:hypothetical protein
MNSPDIFQGIEKPLRASPEVRNLHEMIEIHEALMAALELSGEPNSIVNELNAGPEIYGPDSRRGSGGRGIFNNAAPTLETSNSFLYDDGWGSNSDGILQAVPTLLNPDDFERLQKKKYQFNKPKKPSKFPAWEGLKEWISTILDSKSGNT